MPEPAPVRADHLDHIFDAIAFGMTVFGRREGFAPIRIGMDFAEPGSDRTVVWRQPRHSAGDNRRRRGPILHPTKGYRGAHKLFRGGSR